MKKLAGVALGVVLAATAVRGQSPERVYTEPPVPSQEVLDKLNLKLAWYAFLPTDRRRDGIFTVQLAEVTNPPGRQILTQTRSGTVVALDSETGAIQWRSRVGRPYATTQPLGISTNEVFVVNGVQLFGLSRRTGQVLWEFSMPNAPSSAPIADDERIYLAVGTGRLHAYQLPKPGAPLVAKPEIPTGEFRPESLQETGGAARSVTALGIRGQSLSAVSAVGSTRGQMVRSIGPLSTAGQAAASLLDTPQPQKIWDYLAETRLELAPLLTPEFLLLGGYSGTFYSMNKFNGEALYRFQAGPPLTAQIGQHGEIAYVASQDYTVYALDIVPGRVLWRFVGGGPILRKPVVTDTSVYVTPERSGLYRVDRQTGLTMWRNNDAERFLASSKSFVYASDRSGRLLVLDGLRGTTLGIFDGAREFVVPIANELTDRVYLASNDGLIVCLHERDLAAPLQMKTFPEATAAAADESKRVPAPTGGVTKPAGPARSGGEGKLPQ